LIPTAIFIKVPARAFCGQRKNWRWRFAEIPMSKQLSSPPDRFYLPFCLAGALASLLVGCGDDRDLTVASTERAPSSGEPGVGAPSSDGSLYAVTTQLYSPDQDIAYVELVNDIDRVDDALTTTLEIPGYGLAVGPGRGGNLYVASDQAPTVTRYAVSHGDSAGPSRFEERGVLSFAALGVGPIFAYAGQFQFVSPTKAYFLDSESLQAIIWNPTDMTITGSMDLSALAVPDLTVAFDGEPTRRDRDLVVIAGYYDSDAARVARETRVAFLDVATDAVQIASDVRCGYVTHSVLAPNGDIYLASDTWAVAIHQTAAGDAPDSCMLRIKAGEHEIDPSYRADLAALTGSTIAGSLLPGRGAMAYVRGFDPSLFEGDIQSYDEIWSAGAWRWYSLELGSELPATVVDALPVGAPSSLQLPFDGRTFSNASEADYRSSRLLDMGAEGGPRDVGSVPGIPVGVVRLY
jgi:hypothetical protein